MMESQKNLITIDGPAASGKSSVSRKLASKLGWSWVSTGGFYRGLGYVALESGVDLSDPQGLAKLTQDESLWSIRLGQELTQVFYKNQDVTHLIHHEDVGAIASRISQIPEVRAGLLEAQRKCYLQSPIGLVAEGRDCGTVVFPKAFLKIYLTADQESRAQRRAQEQGAHVASISAMQQKRDEQDKNRKVAPLVMAEDSILIDTTEMTLDEVVEKILNLYYQKLRP